MVEVAKLQCSGSAPFPAARNNHQAGNSGKGHMDDFPNSEPTICRVYGDRGAEIEAECFYEDYIWATQWLWHTTRSKGKRGKLYLVRSLTERNGAGRNGRAEDGRVNTKIFLHVAILKRTGLLPPSPLHTIVDHRDGNTLNLRRTNLRWATPAMNRQNIDGSHPFDLMESC